MARDAGGLVESLERVVRNAKESALAQVRVVLAQYGPRPYGYSTGDMDAALAWWVARDRDNPGPELLRLTQLYGWEYALAEFTIKAGRLERALAHRGAWTGDPADHQRAIAEGIAVVRDRGQTRALPHAERAVRRAERLKAKPQILVGPATPPEPPPGGWWAGETGTYVGGAAPQGWEDGDGGVPGSGDGVALASALAPPAGGGDA